MKRYTQLTEENFEEVQSRYFQLFEEVRLGGQALAASWAEKYPDLADEFGTIAMDELLLAIRRYQNDLMIIGSPSTEEGN